MFGTIDSLDGGDRSYMSTHDLLDRETLLDVLVNVVPLVILAGFVLMFFAVGSYPSDPLVVVVQVSLIVVPALVLIVLTYYAVRAVTRAERAGGSETPPGYSEADAEVLPGDD